MIEMKLPKSRTFIKLAGFALAIIFIFSCKTTQQATVEKEVSYDLENALLWKIEGEELAEPSYLFGTIHLIQSDKFFWPDGTLAAFEESENVVFEVDLDDMFDLSKQMGLLTKAFMSGGQSLKDFYSDEDYKVVKNHFDGMGIPLFFLEKIKPMFLTVFASGDIDMSGGLSGSSSVKSYEMEIYELCQTSNKEVDGLETLEFQMSVFDSIPYQVQADMLLETIKSSDTDNDAFKEMVQMYLDQDINKMVDAMDDEGGIGGYEDILLFQRNKNWIPLIGDMMQKNQTFFAVGAGHLGGKDGVIDLLKKAGYKLTPISHQKSI